MKEQKEQKDSLKFAILIGSGAVFGALLTIAFLYFAPQKEDSKTSSKEESGVVEAIAEKPATAEAETSSAQSQQLPNKYESSQPVSAALAVLNNQPVSAPQTVVLSPGQAVVASPAGSVVQDAQGMVNIYPQYEVAPQEVGRNGLLSNPCADPSSVHGVAYNRRY